MRNTIKRATNFYHGKTLIDNEGSSNSDGSKCLDFYFHVFNWPPCVSKPFLNVFTDTDSSNSHKTLRILILQRILQWVMTEKLNCQKFHVSLHCKVSTWNHSIIMRSILEVLQLDPPLLLQNHSHVTITSCLTMLAQIIAPHISVRIVKWTWFSAFSWNCFMTKQYLEKMKS